MRYHVWKSDLIRYLSRADSQTRCFESGNLIILLLPGAGARHVYDFILPEGMLDRTILFIGENELFDGCDPSSAKPQDVAREIIELAYYLAHRTKAVFVLGILG